MCSPNCMRELQKLWQNSFHAFLMAAAANQSYSSNVQSIPLPSTSATNSFPNQYNFTEFVSQTQFPNILTGLKTTHRRRRRRKRNRNRRFNQFYQQNNHNINGNNNDPNVEMRVRSIVRYWVVCITFANIIRFITFFGLEIDVHWRELS